MRKLTYLWILVLSVVSMGTFAQITNNTDKGKIDITAGSRAFLTLGGDLVEGTLQAEIHDNTNMQIRRRVNSAWQAQIYGTASKGSLLRINGVNYSVSGSYYYAGTAMSLISHTAMATDHIRSIWETAGVVRLTQDVYYTTGTANLRYTWTITNLSSTEFSDIRFFHGQDNTLNGDDRGYSAWDASRNSIIAYTTSGTNQIRLYFQGITVPFGYQGGSYSSCRTNAMSGALSNTADPTYVDQGYALEWRTASIAPSSSYVIDAAEKFSTAAITNVEVTAPISGSVSPGGSKNLRYQVRNLTTSATDVTLNSIVDLTGWTAQVQGSTTINVAANTVQDVIVTVTAPVNALNTTARVTLSAVDASGTASDFCTVTAMILQACENMVGLSELFPIVAAPTNLVYTPNPIVATKGVTSILSNPTNQGGVIASYSISPVLPAGVSINTTTGVISGICTVISSQTAYTITAINNGGITTSVFTLTVNDVPPTALTYTANAIVATKGETNVSSIPTNEGGIIVNYTINPELPAGVFINAVTGSITGIPTVLSTETVYTITGINTGGSTTGTFTLTVNDVPPSNLAYSYNPINAAVNVSNITSTATVQGGPVVSYTVEPTLPTGLTLDAVTGLISGISSEAVTNKNYTVTATNTGGSTTCEVIITVYEGISAPNTITPNGDGINDTWIIPNVADFAGFELTIFNNLGATLYQSSNYNNDWDAKYKGNDLSAGTYYYVFIKGSTVYKGFITVLRAK